MSTNKQALRKLAKVLSGKAWVAFTHKASKTFAVGTLGHKRGEDVVKWTGFDGQANAEAKAKFIAAASPATVIALLDELEAAEKRIAELTAPDGNAIAWESTALPYIKFITDERYQKLRPGYQKWYKPYRCSNCAAGISVKGE